MALGRSKKSWARGALPKICHAKEDLAHESPEWDFMALQQSQGDFVSSAPPQRPRKPLLLISMMIGTYACALEVEFPSPAATPPMSPHVSVG
jgi:hypothetical protein